MITFTRAVATVRDLYVAASDQGGDGGWLGYVLPGAPADLLSFPLLDGFSTYGGSFVLASSAPPLGESGATTLVTNVEALLGDGLRRVVWLLRPDAVSATTTVAFAFDAAAKVVRIGAELDLGANLALNVVSGSGISVQGDAIALSSGPGGAAPVTWSGPAKLTGGMIPAATIACGGAGRGTVQLTQTIDRSALYQGLNWGFQTVIVDTTAPSGYRLGWYPLATTTGPQISIGVSVDPTDIFNRSAADRTAFAFTDAGTSLASGYRTSAGWPIGLTPVVAAQAGQQPARLWLHPSPSDATAKRDLVASPVGDFVLAPQAPAGATTAPELLCGLAGMETIAFAAGDALRFTPQQPAGAARYPYADASPTRAPVDPLAPKLDRSFTTSWAALVPAGTDGGHYSALPRGAALYGKPTAAPAGVLTPTQPGTSLKSGTSLPILPYALVGSATGYSYSIDQYGDVETKVVAPARRTLVTASGASLAASRSSASDAARGTLDDGGVHPATTPSGLVVQVDQTTGAYAEVDLAQTVTGPLPSLMKLTTPGPELHAALQTSQLFCVVTDPTALGNLAGWPATSPADPAFHNAMTIGDWALLADVGSNQTYGSYSNVLIVKGRAGRLADLVAKPDVWTQSGLAIPPKGNASELAAVSQWLQDYIADAAGQSSDYFDAFNALVQDPNWTGILVLEADIAAIPAQLAGMLGGVDRTRFNAHHFGCTITKVDPQTVAMDGNSATFGLIYYVDPAFDTTAKTPQPVAPTASPWDFKVLTLKALFANASVERFESYAQLTLGELFGQPVAHMGGTGANVYDALILTGALHQQDGVTSYGLEVEGDATFFPGGVFNKIEILQAEFSTTSRLPGPNGSTDVAARFDLYGYLDFATLEDDGTPFDLFSFGTSGDVGVLRQGLSFSGLGISMTFNEPADPTAPGSTPVYGFDPSAISFDVARSTARKGSLFSSLALKVDGLVSGDAQTTPSGLGYLDVATDLRLPGVKGDWYGLRLQANFGTPGALAGKIGLTSYVLLAWSPPASADDAPVGLSLLLPGAGQGSSLLSLQGVMKLAVGPVLLRQVPASGGGSGRAFMLVMSEIALKFLGILKLPPSGATAFYLFGDPTGSGGPLGWFALYKGPDPPTPKPPAAAAALASGGDGA